MRYLAIFTLLLIGCHQIKEGVVVEKYVEPESDFLYMMPVPNSYSDGKNTITTYTYIPIWMHDDTDYVVCLKGKTATGKVRTESFYVYKSRYESVKIGQNFCVDDGCSTKPNENTRL